MNNIILEQEITVDNDTLIITDPCYLMKDEHWQHFCDLEFCDNPIGLDNYLRQYHNFGEVLAGSTGYGDWSNTVENTETGEVIGNFTADTGMFIVCTLSDLTNYGYDKDEVQRLQSIDCLTIIPNYSGSVKFYYETNEEYGKLAVIEGIGEGSEDFNFNTLHLED